LIARYLHKWYKYKYGIWIPFNTKIGKGFYIGHFNGIFIGSIVVIGDNCNISQNVTIGKQNVGERIGAPTIGKNVYIAPGAKIFGRINIGDEVAIGANTVVTKDIPDKAVVIGNPDRIVGYNGFDGLVEYTDY
jgi:serine O-acetyltransferase